MPAGRLYTVRLSSTAITAAKTLIQIKTGAAPIDIVSARIFQFTKTSAELLNVQGIFYTSAPTFGTVTSYTPDPGNGLDVAALAVGGTSATGVNASAEPSGGTSVVRFETSWNVLGGEWLYQPTPEERETVKQGGLGFMFKLNTAPAASMNIGAIVKFIEYQ